MFEDFKDQVPHKKYAQLSSKVIETEGARQLLMGSF